MAMSKAEKALFRSCSRQVERAWQAIIITGLESYKGTPERRKARANWRYLEDFARRTGLEIVIDKFSARLVDPLGRFN